MSATTTPADTDTVAPEKAFDEAVWKNAECCNGCLSRVKRVHEDTVLGVSTTVVEDHRRTTDATLEPDDEILEFVEGSTRRPGLQRRPTTRTTCGECGRVGCWDENDDRSRIGATQRCKLIFPWLRRLGVAFDRRTTTRYVWNAKGDPDNQGSDVEIYRDAVKAGVKAARKSR